MLEKVTPATGFARWVGGLCEERISRNRIERLTWKPLFYWLSLAGYGLLKVPKILLGVLKNPRASHFLKVFAAAVDGPLMRWSGGRIRLSFVIPMLLLEVVGARSKTLRRVPLLYVDTNDGLIVVGSNGGSRREPAWCKNLRANRSVTCLVKGRRERYEAAEMHCSAYAAAWRSAVSTYPNYALYQERLSSRTIPLFRLSRTPHSSTVTDESQTFDTPKDGF